MSDDSTKIAHLTMIQSIISRMASNSFTLKTLSVSFVGAWIAFLAATEEYSLFFLAAPMVPTIMFWLLDAQYLKLERSYRQLYEHVRCDQGVDKYSMDFTPFSKNIGGIWKSAFSWSVLVYYATMLILILSIGLYLMRGEPHA